MGTFESDPLGGFFVVPTPAPTTPMNLRLGVIYQPRVPTPPFAAYEAIEVRPDVYEIRGYNDREGLIVSLYQGHLLRTYQNLARHLRMDLPPNTSFGKAI